MCFVFWGESVVCGKYALCDGGEPTLFGVGEGGRGSGEELLEEGETILDVLPTFLWSLIVPY